MKVTTIVGTRPEAIKMAPVIRHLNSNNTIDSVVCSTSQHGVMLQQVLDIFDIHPDFDLNVMVPNQQLNGLFSSVISSVDEMLEEVKPDWVLVHGDTTTAVASAIAAFHKNVRIGHVEAGLRTGNFEQPWPEEMYRTVIDSFADHCYAPTQTSRNNLQNQGIDDGRIFVTGNTVIEAFNHMAEIIDSNESLKANLKEQFSYMNEKAHCVLVTGHRRENFGAGIQNVCLALKEIAERGDSMVVYPVHLNPNIKGPVMDILGDIPEIKLIEPLDYTSFVYLMKNASVILTDSGGIQEEASSLGKPILVMRDVTERPEAVEAGLVKLVGTDTNRIVEAVGEYLSNIESEQVTRINGHNPYGDGQAAKKIIDALLTM